MAHISKMDWTWIIALLWIGVFAGVQLWTVVGSLSIGKKFQVQKNSILSSIQSTQNMAMSYWCAMIELNAAGSIIYVLNLHPFHPWPNTHTRLAAPGVYWFLRGKCQRLPGNCYFASRYLKNHVEYIDFHIMLQWIWTCSALTTSQRPEKWFDNKYCRSWSNPKSCCRSGVFQEYPLVMW